MNGRKTDIALFISFLLSIEQVKPDGVERGLVGEIIKRFENKGFQLVALQLLKVRSLSLLTVKSATLLLSTAKYVEKVSCRPKTHLCCCLFLLATNSPPVPPSSSTTLISPPSPSSAVS